MARMDRDHPKWAEFVERLKGPEGCNFNETRPGDESSVEWSCLGGMDRSKAESIMSAMKLSKRDREASHRFFREEGGHCDCEILFNVNR